MTQRDTTSAKKNLLRIQTAIITRLGLPCAPSGGDEGDVAMENLERTIGFANTEQLLMRLKLVEEALIRIHQGTYGVCLTCTRQIPRARILSLPEASRCVGCQATLENPHSNTRGVRVLIADDGEDDGDALLRQNHEPYDQTFTDLIETDR